MGGAGSGSATPEQVDAAELAVLLAAGTSVAAIAALFGCTGSTVRNTASRHGLVVPPQRRGRTHRPRVERAPLYPRLHEPGWLQERCTAGVPPKAVAAEAGRSVTTVRAVADRLGIVRRRRATRPQLSDVGWLRQAHLEGGLSLNGIARPVAAGDSAVSQALARAGAPTRRIARRPRLADADWLRSVYMNDGLAAPAIAERLGLHENTVCKALARAGVPRRRGGGRPSRWLTDAAWLRAQYLDADRTATSIANEVGRSPSGVRQALARHGIHKPPPPRPSKRQLIADWSVGRRSPRWPGGTGRAGDALRCGWPRSTSSSVRHRNSQGVPCGLDSDVATMSRRWRGGSGSLRSG